MIYHTPMGIIDNHFKTQFRLLRNQNIDFLIESIIDRFSLQVTIQLGRCYDTPADLIEIEIHSIILSGKHFDPLFPKRDKQLFRSKSPIEKNAYGIDRIDFEYGKFAHQRIRAFGRGNDAILTVVINKNIYFISDFIILRDITQRQKYIPFFSSIEINAEIDSPKDLQRIVISDINHKKILTDTNIRQLFGLPFFFYTFVDNNPNSNLKSTSL